MGWQDRDYARFTEAERKRFYGHTGASYRATGRSRSLSWVLVLAVVSLLGMFVLPHVAIHGHHYRIFLF